MGLVKEEKLTAQYVLNRVSESDIFAKYFGPFSFKKTYSSVFRTDSNPSTGFYINRSGKIIYNDITTGEKLDCFAFVAKLNHTDYGAAVYKVACDFGVIDCKGVTPIKRAEVKRAEQVTEQIKKETIIEIIPEPWGGEYLDYWAQFSITQEELERDQIYAVRKLFVNGKVIPNYRHDLRFAYVVDAGDKQYKKIYTPYAEKQNFKWISNVPLHIPFGITSLPFLSNTVIVTKSQKDRILFKKYFTDVIATQNESPSAMHDKTVTWLAKRYDRMIMNQDLDEAGIRSCTYFMDKGFTPLYVPEIVKERHGIKDFADMVKHYGLHKMEAYLKYLHLL